MSATPTPPAAGGPAEPHPYADSNHGDDDIDDEGEDNEIEVSPSGRWKRMRAVYPYGTQEAIESNLAYDNEKGIMAVWNQTLLSKKRWDLWSKQSKSESGPSRMSELRAKIEKEFKTLLEIKHVNIVAFLDYWTDGNWDKMPPTLQDAKKPPRVVWIAEQMTAGTLKKHIKTVKGNKVQINPKIWKRWCQQILSALRYLHNKKLPHGNIKSSTIHVQHKGAIKLGSPEMKVVSTNVKTQRTQLEDWVYIAPDAIRDEYVSGNDSGDEATDDGEASDAGEGSEAESPRDRQLKRDCKADIYAFGIVVLEMICLSTPYSEYPNVTEMIKAKNENIMPECLTALQGGSEWDVLRHDFVKECLQPMRKRPSAEKLMHSQVLHTVPPLQHFAAHRLVEYMREQDRLVEEKSGGTAHFDTHEWLTERLIDPYRKWVDGNPWSISRNMYPDGPGEGPTVLLPFPTGQVDIEQLLDEVAKGLHEKYSVMKPRPAVQAAAGGAVPTGTASDDTAQGQGTHHDDAASNADPGEASAAESECGEPVEVVPFCPEEMRVNEDDIHVVINNSEDDQMEYDVSVSFNLRTLPPCTIADGDGSTTAATTSTTATTTTTGTTPVSTNTAGSEDNCCTITRRLVEFGYPKDLRDSQMVIDQLTRCCLLHADDGQRVKQKIDEAIAEHAAARNRAEQP